MKAYYGSRISEHMTKTPEGYLICLSVPIARIGTQDYLSSELGVEDESPNKVLKVERPQDEVFSAATLASFEGKPVTDDHPNESVNPQNIAAYDCGHVQNVRRGTGADSDLLIADLFITNTKLIEAIQSGRREVSCGYDCDYEQSEDGTIYQRAIRGNHVAVVENGRAGHRVAIKDASPHQNNSHQERGRTRMAKKDASLFARLFSRAVRDMEPEEIEDAIQEMANAASEEKAADEAAPAAPATQPAAAPAADEGGDVMGKLLEAIVALTAKVDAIAACKGNDEEPAADPLKKLEDELTVPAEPAADEDEVAPDGNEDAVTVPAEEINTDEDETLDPGMTDEDEVIEAEEKKVVVDPDEKKKAALAALNAVKPVIASLPEGERKAAADKAAIEIRKLMGKTARARSNGYLGIANTMRNSAKKRVGDSKRVDNGDLGRSIMASRNPHYKKEAK